MRNLLLGLGAATLAAAPNISAAADAPAVVASIKPIHSLVEGIMKGVGRPGPSRAGRSFAAYLVDAPVRCPGPRERGARGVGG